MSGRRGRRIAGLVCVAGCAASCAGPTNDELWQPFAIWAEATAIGAGISGLSAAYHLVRSGLSVVVLDDGPICGGETGRTTAHLSNALDDRYSELERLFGRDGARQAARSHTAAIDRIEAIAAEEGIACSFERLDGYLFVPPGESTVNPIRSSASTTIPHDGQTRSGSIPSASSRPSPPWTSCPKAAAALGRGTGAPASP